MAATFNHIENKYIEANAIDFGLIGPTDEHAIVLGHSFEDSDGAEYEVRISTFRAQKHPKGSTDPNEWEVL